LLTAHIIKIKTLLFRSRGSPRASSRSLRSPTSRRGSALGCPRSTPRRRRSRPRAASRRSPRREILLLRHFFFCFCLTNHLGCFLLVPFIYRCSAEREREREKERETGGRERLERGRANKRVFFEFSQFASAFSLPRLHFSFQVPRQIEPAVAFRVLPHTRYERPPRSAAMPVLCQAGSGPRPPRRRGSTGNLFDSDGGIPNETRRRRGRDNTRRLEPRRPPGPGRRDEPQPRGARRARVRDRRA